MESIQTFSELLRRCEGYPVICIHGKSAAGKTTVASRLGRHLGLKVYHTDDYKQHGWEQSLYVMMAELSEREKVSCVIEGVQVPRLLRKGFRTDLVIEVVCDDELRIRRYYQRGDGVKVGNLASFDATLAKIWGEVRLTCPVIRYNTDPLDTGF